MLPSTPSTSDGKSASANTDIATLTADLNRAERSKQIYNGVSRYFASQNWSRGAKTAIDDTERSLMARLDEEITERQTLLKKASEAYTSSLSPTQRLDIETSGEAQGDMTDHEPKLEVVTKDETDEILRVIQETQAESPGKGSWDNIMYDKVKKVLSSGKIKV